MTINIIYIILNQFTYLMDFLVFTIVYDFYCNFICYTVC